MKTNKPGSVNQQPLYGCTSCYEECTYPADHLHVYDNECWCDLCWDERRWDFPDQPYWNDLEPYTPALQAECEELREHLQNLIDQTTPLEPVPGNPMWSRRIQLDEVVAERDQLRAECEKLRKDAETERAIQRAAEVLPPGFRIEIEIEKDYGGVALFSPAAIVECDFQGGLAEQIADAIDAAMQGDQP